MIQTIFGDVASLQGNYSSLWGSKQKPGNIYTSNF